MPKYFAVKCKSCEAIITLDEIPDEPNTAPVGVPPLEPIVCPECGSHYLYGSDDVIEIELPDVHTQEGRE